MTHSTNPVNFTAFKKAGALTLLVIMLAMSSLNLAWAVSLDVTLETDKLAYTAGDTIQIHGNLTWDNGTSVTDGLVTTQVNDPHNNLIVLRTCKTGANLPGTLPIDIASIVTVGSTGQPQGNFARGSYLGLNVTLRNTGLPARSLIMAINAYASNGVPFGAQIMFNGTIDGSETVSIVSWPVLPVPRDATLGTATVYVNVLTPQLPKNGGFALSQEKSTSFTISISGSSLEVPLTSPVSLTSIDGTYSASFRTPNQNAKLGDYNIYVISFYIQRAFPYFATNTLKFPVRLLGDLNGDLKVDIKDLVMIAKAYGTTPGMPKWNPRADMNSDLRVDIKDLAIVAKEYGKTGSV